ncbi:MBL fold metallo-hydrolase [uncultured Oscillibacter sp.]|uniref:MBL fold metallo-hydrolase n=1 Tax=uncultured Oscillibacter sp. TaxID=876091 RepID=UPI0026146249|nr:hypothetical protein [uncultured Oscillibacter sp.]
MSTCSITLTANAGVILEWNQHVIWIDALHTQQVPGFSAVRPADWERIQQTLPPPELLCFTHCHPDHYSFPLASQARSLWPNAAIALPRQDFADQLLISGEETRLSRGGMTLRFLRLPHEGPDFQNDPHYGLLLSDHTSHILIPGDCETASPSLLKRLDGLPIDLAILNFPWITLRKGRRCLEDVLRPRHLMLCHLPFAEDDTNGYLDAALRAARTIDLPDVRLLTQPLQREEL